MDAPERVSPPLSVATLAGGLSRRMGTDKALLRLIDGGPTLLERVLAAVDPLTDDLFIVASGREEYRRFGADLVPDRFPGAGTLGAIATALKAARHDALLVVGCDMPFLSPPLLRWMGARPRHYDVLIPTLPGRSRQGSGTIYQTLHAIYRQSCLGPIERSLAAGRFQVIAFFDEVTVVEVPAEIARRHDPTLRTFFNANTPEAAEEARRLLGGDG